MRHWCYSPSLDSESLNRDMGEFIVTANAHYKEDSAVHLTIPLIIGFSKMLLRNSCISFFFFLNPHHEYEETSWVEAPSSHCFLRGSWSFRHCAKTPEIGSRPGYCLTPHHLQRKKAQSLPPRPINHGALGSLPRALTSSRGSDPAFDLPLCA